MSFMFLFATSFAGTGIDQWAVGNTKTLFGFLHGASKFNADISGWDVSSCTDFTTMFEDAAAFNVDLCSWGTKMNTGAAVISVFTGSGCPEQGNPDLSINPKGPLCFACP